MFKLFQVRENQRGLWFRSGKFVDILMPGQTWLLGEEDRVEIVDIKDAPMFEHAMLDELVEHPQVREQLEVLNLESMDRAVVWKDGRLFSILGPGLHAFWKIDDTRFEIEVDSIVENLMIHQRKKLQSHCSSAN